MKCWSGARVVMRWLRWISLTALLPIAACSQELPMPEGVNPQATPRIIVRKERIEINGQQLLLRLTSKDVWGPWIAALGPPGSDNGVWTGYWESLGLVMKAGEREPSDYSGELDIFLRQGRYFFWGEKDPKIAAGIQPRKPFPGYLEIDGVPIGPAMQLEEIQKWRKKLGLPLLTPGGEYYRTGEDYKWAQWYFFDDDGFLAWIQFL